MSMPMKYNQSKRNAMIAKDNAPPASFKYNDLQNEIKRLRTQLTQKDAEISALRERLNAIDTTSISSKDIDGRGGCGCSSIEADTGKEHDCSQTNEIDRTDHQTPLKLKILYKGSDEEGTGSSSQSGPPPTPTDGDVITIHYTILLQSADDGKTARVIEDSRERREGSPYSFILGKGKVVPGWENALQQMHKGEVAEVVIPSDMAYGSDGFGESIIAPNQDLVCKIELIDFRKYDAPFRPWIINE